MHVVGKSNAWLLCLVPPCVFSEAGILELLGFPRCFWATSWLDDYGPAAWLVDVYKINLGESDSRLCINMTLVHRAGSNGSV